jgi:hypothetical protein
MAYGGLIFKCVILSIIGAAIINGIVHNSLKEFPTVNAIIQGCVTIGFIVGAVYYYNHEADKRDKAAEKARENEKKAQQFDQQVGNPTRSIGGEYTMSNVFQGGVHNPFAAL